MHPAPLLVFLLVCRLPAKGLIALTDMLLRQVRHWGRAAGDKHSDSEGLYLTSWRRASTGVWPAALQRSRRPWPWGLLCRGLSQACELRGSAGTEADLGSVKRAAKAGLQSGGGGRWLGGRGAAGALRPRFIPLGIGRAGLAGSVGGLVGTGAWLPSRPSRCCGLSMGVGAARGPMSIRRDEVKIGRARGCPAQSQRRHRVYPGHRCCPAPTKTACARMSAGCSAWALSRSFTCCVLRLPVQM